MLWFVELFQPFYQRLRKRCPSWYVQSTRVHTRKHSTISNDKRSRSTAPVHDLGRGNKSRHDDSIRVHSVGSDLHPPPIHTQPITRQSGPKLHHSGPIFFPPILTPEGPFFVFFRLSWFRPLQHRSTTSINVDDVSEGNRNLSIQSL